MSNNAEATTMQDRSESSAKYKVGDRVKFVDEDCVVSGVTETLTGRWRYNIERNGVCIAVGVTENMLDPAEEVAKMSDQGEHGMSNEIRQPLTAENWKGALQTLESTKGQCKVEPTAEYIPDEVRKKMEVLLFGAHDQETET